MLMMLRRGSSVETARAVDESAAEELFLSFLLPSFFLPSFHNFPWFFATPF